MAAGLGGGTLGSRSTFIGWDVGGFRRAHTETVAMEENSGFRKVRASRIVSGSLGRCGSPRDSRACSKSALLMCYCVFGGGPAAGLEQPARCRVTGRTMPAAHPGWLQGVFPGGTTGPLQLGRRECARHTDTSLHCLGRSHFSVTSLGELAHLRGG